MNGLANLHRMMWGRVSAICDDNSAIILPQTDIHDITVALKLNITKFDSLESRYDQSTASGSAVQKNIFWETAATNISRWGIRLHVQAHKDGLFTLESLINKSQSELQHKKVLSAYNEMVAMKDGMKSNSSHFVVQKFTPAVVTGLEDDLKNLHDEIHKPQLETKESLEIKSQIEDVYAEIETQVSDIVSLLVSEFKVSQPEMTGNLILANILGKSQGHHYTGITGTGTVDGLPMTGYSLTILKTPNKIVKFDLLGAYSEKSIRPGLTEIILKDPKGVEVGRKTVKFMSGTMITINWEL